MWLTHFGYLFSKIERVLGFPESKRQMFALAFHLLTQRKRRLHLRYSVEMLAQGCDPEEQSQTHCRNARKAPVMLIVTGVTRGTKFPIAGEGEFRERMYVSQPVRQLFELGWT